MITDYNEAYEMVTTGPGLAISSIVSLVSYVLLSWGLYTMAKNREIRLAWLAWIPLGQLYVLGELTGNKMWGFTGSKWVLLLSPFVIGLVGAFIPLLGSALYIVYRVYFVMVLYRLFSLYTKHPLLYSILALFFSPLAESITIFAVRNRRPKYIY